ncbi:6792_t:CDS:2, partial [Acaulospora colombiana]
PPRNTMQTTETKEQRVYDLCNEARQKFLQYSGGPAPPDLFVQARWSMANVHLLLTDAVQNIYDQAESITEAQQSAFIQYAYFSEQVLHHHHWFEETIAFPIISPEFQCDILEEHAAFSDAMERWEEYLESLLGLEKNKDGKAVPSLNKTKAVYDSKRMKRYIEDMSEPLFVHLMHEIDWLAPENIRTSGLPLSKLERLKEDPFTFGCWVVAHGRPELQFPEMPWLGKKVLFPWVFYWKYRSVSGVTLLRVQNWSLILSQAWQFAPKYPIVEKSQ